MSRSIPAPSAKKASTEFDAQMYNYAFYAMKQGNLSFK